MVQFSDLNSFLFNSIDAFVNIFPLKLNLEVKFETLADFCHSCTFIDGWPDSMEPRHLADVSAQAANVVCPKGKAQYSWPPSTN